MKTLTKRIALITGLLCTALICMGIVYIDTVNNYWQFSGGFIRLVVNTNAQAVITIDTNTQAVGIFTNEISRSFQVVGRRVATNTTGNGSSASTSGSIQFVGSDGGHSSASNAGTVSGGTAGGVTLRGGVGGNAQNATTNATGGAGGALALVSGAGGVAQSAGGLATNALTGGNGGAITITSGAGGSPSIAATNTVAGSAGNFSLTAASGGTPSAGWSRKGGNGGGFVVSAGGGGGSTRTNGGAAGSVSFSAGSGGSASTTPGNGGDAGGVTFAAGNGGSAAAGGNPAPGGDIAFTAGNGSTGDTNSNGGNIYLSGGSPGSGAKAGDVVVGRPNDGSDARGGLMIGPLLGGSASITNLLGAAAALDFGSTATLTSADLPITVTGATSNNCAVALSVPWESAAGGGSFSTFASNDTIYVRFANNTALSIDPGPGTFSVVVFRIR